MRARRRRQTSRPSSFGQHHVEHDEVEGLLGEARQRLAAVRGLHDLVAVRCSGKESSVWIGCSSSTRRMRGARSGMSRKRRYRAISVCSTSRVYRAAFLPALHRGVRGRVLARRAGPRRVRDPRGRADAFDAGARVRQRARRATRCSSSAPRSPTAGPARAGDARWPTGSRGVFDAAGFAGPPRLERRGRTIDGEADARDGRGVRPGLSPRRIVVLAHRDAVASPGLAELSGTAALLELARIFRTRVSRPRAPGPAGRSSSAATCAGRSCSSRPRAAAAAPPARAPGRATPDPSLIDGVLVLGDLASAKCAQAVGRAVVQRRATSRRSASSAPSRLAVRAEVGERPRRRRARPPSGRGARSRSPSPSRARSTAPGSRPRCCRPAASAGPAPGAELSRARFTALGRAALRTVTALDEAGPRRRGRRGPAALAGRARGRRHAAQRGAGLERPPARPLPARARAARRARRVLPRPPPARRHGRVARLGARGRRDRAARLGVAAACSASPARSPRRAPRWRRACSSSPAGRSPRWPPSRSRSSAGVVHRPRADARRGARRARPPAAPGRRPARSSARSRSPSGCANPYAAALLLPAAAPLALPRHAADADARRGRLARARSPGSSRPRSCVVYGMLALDTGPLAARAHVAGRHGRRPRLAPWRRWPSARSPARSRCSCACCATAATSPRVAAVQARHARPAHATPAPARSAARSPRCGDERSSASSPGP